MPKRICSRKSLLHNAFLLQASEVEAAAGGRDRHLFEIGGRALATSERSARRCRVGRHDPMMSTVRLPAGFR